MADAVCKCGATAAHAADPTRCAKGHPLVGAPSPALKHGAYSFEARGPAALPADLRISVDELKAQIISDRGGLDALTGIERAYILRLSELETVVRLLASDLAQRGLLTARGRVRSSVSKWLETLDRWDRFAMRIGTDSRRPTLTLSQRLAAAAPLTTETDGRDADQ